MWAVVTITVATCYWTASLMLDWMTITRTGLTAVGPEQEWERQQREWDRNGYDMLALCKY